MKVRSSLLYVGEGAIFAVAAMLAAFELWLWVERRGERRHLWTGLVCVATATFAAAAFEHYQTRELARVAFDQKVELVSLSLLSLSIVELGTLRTGRPPPVAWIWRAVTLSWVIVLLTTHWVVEVEISYQELAFLDHPYPQPIVTTLGAVFFGYNLLLASCGALGLVRRSTERRGWLVAGLVVWIGAGAHDVLLVTDTVPLGSYLMEYGFLGFALALVSVHVGEYSSLLRASELARRELEGQHHAALERGRRVEELSHIIVSRVEEGLATMDAEWRVHLWNPAMERLTGTRREDALGRSFCECIPSEDDALAGAVLDQVGAADGPEQIELTMSVTGRRVRVTFVRSNELGAARIVVVRDVTAARERTERKAEVDRMVAMGTLAAGVGHEINNPLAYVMSNLQFALAELGSGDESVREALEEALEGTERIGAVVRELRAMTRDAGADVARDVPLHRVVGWAAKMVANELKHRSTLYVRCDESLTVRGVESRLGQVFLNLLINAAHAIPPGDVKANRITVTATPIGGRVVITVSDTGTGLPKEHARSVFDPFFTTKPSHAGSGLGLAICRRIVEEHEGTISIQTASRGTTFRVELPAGIGEEPSDGVCAHEPLHAQVARVLLIDDEERVARAFARLLRDAAEVRVCGSGAEALEILRADPGFDLVLCDLLMPEMTGLRLLTILEEEMPSVAERTVLLTGGALGVEQARFCEQNPERVLFKPLRADELRARVARALMERPGRAAVAHARAQR